MRYPMAIYKRFIQFRCEGHRGFMAASGSHRRFAPVTAHQFTSYLSFCRISACMTVINKTRDASARRRSLSDRSHRRSARVSVKSACIASSCFCIPNRHCSAEAKPFRGSILPPPCPLLGFPNGKPVSQWAPDPHPQTGQVELSDGIQRNPRTPRRPTSRSPEARLYRSRPTRSALLLRRKARKRE